MKQIIKNKASEVTLLATDLEKATSVLVFEYHGVSAKVITTLRNSLHKANAKMYVSKNNIFNRAFKEANIVNVPEFVGPSAIIISRGDQLTSFKEIYKLLKDGNKLVYKLGLIDTSIILPNQLSTIASIPSKEGLLSMLLSCLQGPVRNLLYGLTSLSETKQQ